MLDILVVDDDDIIRESVCAALVGAGYKVTGVPDGERALSILGGARFDVALCDVQLPGIDGISLFRRLRRDAPGTDVVLMTAFGKVSDAVATVRDGAEYVTKPFDPDDLARDVIEPIARRRAASRVVRVPAAARPVPPALVGSSMVMRRLADRMAAVARIDSGVLVVGEPGSGKDVIARRLHAYSGRRSGPLASVASASLVSPHGAGARADAFRMAEGGTLVIDGVEALSLGAQEALLQLLVAERSRMRSWREALPAGAMGRLGSAGVRVVALSRDDLSARVAAGTFVVRLYFELAEMELRVPPLRERAGDVYLLVTHLLREHALPGRPAPDLTPDAWRALHDYPFPGKGMRGTDERRASYSKPS